MSIQILILYNINKYNYLVKFPKLKVRDNLKICATWEASTYSRKGAFTSTMQ